MSLPSCAARAGPSIPPVLNPRRVRRSALSTASGQEPARPSRWSPYSVSAWSWCCRTHSATGPKVDVADCRRDHRAQEMSPLARHQRALSQALSSLDDLLLALAPPRRPTPRSLLQKPKITRHHTSCTLELQVASSRWQPAADGGTADLRYRPGGLPPSGSPASRTPGLPCHGDQRERSGGSPGRVAALADSGQLSEPCSPHHEKPARR